MSDSNDLEIGKAGEHLVCFDLICKNHSAMLSSQGMRFDVVANVNHRLIKIQVKTTRKPMVVPQRANDWNCYIFHSRRCGKNGRQGYVESDADIFAFVAIDSRQIGYVAASKVKQTMIFRPEEHRGKYYDEVMTKRAQVIRDMFDRGMKKIEIAKELSIDLGYVGKIISRKTDSYIKGIYLSDFSLDSALMDIGAIT